MMILVIGGSGSGKSLYAEEIAVSLAGGNRCMEPYGNKILPRSEQSGGIDSCMQKYYLATMRVFDEEGQRKIDKHRKLRSGKGFLTIEQPSVIHQALEKMEAGKRTVLLECILNLTANEMFAEIYPASVLQVTERILNGIGQLKDASAHLVVVSGNIFEDGTIYDEATMAYMRAVGKINQRLAAMADQVVEVVAGIPLLVS